MSMRGGFSTTPYFCFILFRQSSFIHDA